MAKYSFEQLEKKYNGFVGADCAIDIDGFVLTEKATLRSVTVQISALYEAGYAEFTVFDGVSEKNGGFAIDGAIASKLKIGKGVAVKLGYAGKLCEVFKGYVDSVRINYAASEGFSITVICLDGKGLMMNSARSEIKTNIKRYSDAVKKTLGTYSSFFSVGKVQQTAELALPFSQLNESDYDFVVRLAKRLNFSFYIKLGKAYFVPVGDDRTEIFELTPNVRLKNFSIETSLKNRLSKVVVVNNDETDEKKRIKAEASSINCLESGSSSKAAANSAIIPGMVRTISDSGAVTVEIAKTIAQAQLDRMSYSSVDGSAETVGIPEIQAGQFLAVSGFGSAFEKNYYIKKVTHRIVGNRFSTSIELGGNGI